MLRTRNIIGHLGLCGALLCVACPVSAKPKAKAPPPAATPAAVGDAPGAPASASPAPADVAHAPAAEGGAAPEPAAPVAAATAAPAAATGHEQDSAAQGSTAADPAAASSSEPKRPQLSAEKLAALRADTSQLIDEMSQARAKAALLGKTLFKTQLRLKLQNLAAPDPRLIKVVLKLDGSPVFTGDGATLSGDDARQVFEGFIAPGRHVLTAELEQQSREDATFGYDLHDTYNFKAQRDKLSELTLIVDDDSDMASDYPDDGDGEYDVRLKLRVRTKNIGEE